MKNKTEVEIIVPIVDGQKKGDINYMNKKDALNYHNQGLVKIIDYKKPTKKPTAKKVKVKTLKLIQKPHINISPLKQIIERHKSLKGNCHINIFAGDDKKSGKKPYSTFFNLATTDLNKIQSESERLNINCYGTFLNINPLDKPQRVKANIKRIFYAFIDLDDAQEEHNELVKEYLNKKSLTYSYNAKSGHGYHFLIPIDLAPVNEPKIKGFLNYLKENCTQKVDLATADLGRLMRFPESIHNKDEDSKILKTLHSHTPTEEEIKLNSELLVELQLSQKKGVKDIQYQNSIQKPDSFFNIILAQSSKWNKYYKYLNKAQDRNGIFIKNLGIFIKHNPEHLQGATSFLQEWESSRTKAMRGWIKKAEKNNLNVNYLELLKWANTHNLGDWKILLMEQNKSSFLDKYEFYYLEDEKKDNAYLMYYPEKNYYVTKNLPDILVNIYYDCLESGVDLETEFDPASFIEGYDGKSFKDKMGILKGLINSKIHKENRIKLVFNINYAPIEDKFIYLNKKKFFNTYNKTELWDYYKKTNKHQFKHIKELLMNLCDKKEENYNYLNKWLAWIIKNPTEKLPTALILQGKAGSGKGTFKNLILDNIFGENCQEINQTHLESAFNEYLMSKQIIVANEVMHNENRQTLPNILKNLVTDETITISRKFKKEIVGRNYTHWIFCTNSDNPIKIDEDDRRYSVFYSEKIRRGLPKELRQNLDYELKEYVNYLKSIDVCFEDVSEPIMTDSKKEIIELNKDSVSKFIDELKRYSDIHSLYLDLFGHDKELKYVGDGMISIDTTSFYKSYIQWCSVNEEKGVFKKQNFSKKLSGHNLKSFVSKIKNPILNKYDSIRVYSVDNIESLMEVQE